MSDSKGRQGSGPQDDSCPAGENIELVGKSARLWICFVLVAVAAVALDLWTKHAVFSWVGSLPPDIDTRAYSKVIIPGVLHFTLSTNPGVVFGFNSIPRPIVVAASFVAFVLIGGFFAFTPKKAHWSHLALAMIAGGAAGNLYDRLCSHVLLPGMIEPAVRQVRDFIDFSPFHIGKLHYPWIFNVADVFLVVGVGILLITSFAASAVKDSDKAAKSGSGNTDEKASQAS